MESQPQPPSSDDPEEFPAETLMLLQRAKTGDQHALGDLFEHLAPAIYAWADLRMTPRQRQVLEPGDVVQEVFLRALRGIDQFVVEGPSIRAWLFRIAKNVLLEVSRAARRNASSTSPETREALLQALPASITAITQRLSRDEALARFREELAALPEEDRALVTHCGLEGMGRSEVATLMGLSVEAVTKRWQRLRAKLELGGLPSLLLALS